MITVGKDGKLLATLTTKLSPSSPISIISLQLGISSGFSMIQTALMKEATRQEHCFYIWLWTNLVTSVVITEPALSLTLFVMGPLIVMNRRMKKTAKMLLCHKHTTQRDPL